MANFEIPAKKITSKKGIFSDASGQSPTAVARHTPGASVDSPKVQSVGREVALGLN